MKNLIHFLALVLLLKEVCAQNSETAAEQCLGENEEFTGCVCPCCERCSTLGQKITCNFLVCLPGCDCKSGYFHNSNGTCVPPEECDCGENEILELCSNPCPPRTCDAIGKRFKCKATDSVTCKPACNCKFNFRRNSEGYCVPIAECPPLTCTGKFEVYDSCPKCRNENCESLHQPVSPCLDNEQECFPRCVCQPGYLRDKDWVCVPKEKCAE